MEGALYPIFEIELFFKNGKIVICHSGDEVRYYESDKKTKALLENLDRRHSGILANYMTPVIDRAVQLLGKDAEPDNFLQAVELNTRMIKLISGIRKKSG